MENTTINHPFYTEIDREVARIKKKADSYRWGYYIIRIAMILITAVITIISGWKEQNNTDGTDTILNVLLLLGTFSTIVTTIDSLFQIETKKNTYKLMLFELREIRREFTYHFSTGNDKQLHDLIEKRLFPYYQSIMNYSKSLIERDKESTISSKMPNQKTDETIKK